MKEVEQCPLKLQLKNWTYERINFSENSHTL